MVIRNTKKPPLFETLDSNNDDGIAPLTPGHLLIGRPLEALPHQVSTTPIPVLKRWRMCQALTQHFCKRWSTEYLNSLQRFSKWRLPRRNLVVGDIVLIKDNRTPPLPVATLSHHKNTSWTRSTCSSRHRENQGRNFHRANC